MLYKLQVVIIGIVNIETVDLIVGWNTGYNLENENLHYEVDIIYLYILILYILY